MNIAVSTLVEFPANSVSTTVKMYVERERLYTVILAVGAVGGTATIRYLDGAGVLKLSYAINAPNPAIYAVGADVSGTIEIVYAYVSNVAARTVPLVVAKEITV